MQPALLKFNNLKRQARHMAVPAVLLILSLASTWPLVTAPADSLPMGTETSSTVPLFNVWTVWWNSQSAVSGYSGYWDAPIFYPQKGAFAFSEPMPLSIIAAPIIWATGNRILAYNFLLILSLCLNGWATFSLLRRLNFDLPVQWTGGVMMTLLPLIHSWVGVLQLVPVFGILWTISALLKFAQRPTAIGGVLLGVAFSVTYLLCAYYGLFLVIPLALSLAWMIGNHLFRWGTWRSLGLGLIAAGIICSPVAMRQAKTQHLHAPLPQQYLAGFSALAADYLVPPWPHWSKLRRVSGQADSNFDGFRLCPGFLKLALAAAGIGFGLVTRNNRRWTLFCLTLMCTAFVLSLGPWLRIWHWQPYMLLVNYVPGFGQARNVFRFSILVHIMVVLLAMTGLQGILTAVRPHIHKPRLHKLAVFLIIGLGVAAAAEILPPGQSLHRAKDFLPTTSWVKYLAEQTPEKSVIACIPFPFRPDVAGYEQEALWMYRQTFHHRQMVNGYSGYFPPEYLSLKLAMTAFPALDSLSRLRDLGVNYCVVKRDSIFAEPTRKKAATGLELELTFSDDSSQIDIYRLRR
ncbi:hypothetical protein [uncultured Desulfobacter sp.]|uniref:hypothetical protein n=1 Tax=uncultured Desulfobacter sp. TaxID=240139 RepID=UPI002AA936D3|nr:hypothetical protein [uncultured Desulfobacter sp.]